MATIVTALSTTLTVDPSRLSVIVAFDSIQTTQVSRDPVSERNDKASTIIAASTVIGFLFLGLTGVLLFLKITRYLRVRRDDKRFREWNSLETSKAHPRNRHFVGRRSMKNAFDIIEDDEGIPA